MTDLDGWIFDWPDPEWIELSFPTPKLAIAFTRGARCQRRRCLCAAMALLIYQGRGHCRNCGGDLLFHFDPTRWRDIRLGCWDGCSAIEAATATFVHAYGRTGWRGRQALCEWAEHCGVDALAELALRFQGRGDEVMS